MRWPKRREVHAENFWTSGQTRARFNYYLQLRSRELLESSIAIVTDRVFRPSLCAVNLHTVYAADRSTIFRQRPFWKSASYIGDAKPTVLCNVHKRGDPYMVANVEGSCFNRHVFLRVLVSVFLGAKCGQFIILSLYRPPRSLLCESYKRLSARMRFCMTWCTPPFTRHSG